MRRRGRPAPSQRPAAAELSSQRDPLRRNMGACVTLPAWQPCDMTWSILARDPATGELGVAVATRFFAVGAICPRVEGEVGAVATQALVNPLLAPRSLDLLRAGEAPGAALAVLLAA